MNWQTYPDEPEVHLGITLSQLRHVITGLVSLTRDPSLTIDEMDTNSMLIELLLQVENDEMMKYNSAIDEEERVRRNGEP